MVYSGRDRIKEPYANWPTTGKHRPMTQNPQVWVQGLCVSGDGSIPGMTLGCASIDLVVIVRGGEHGRVGRCEGGLAKRVVDHWFRLWAGARVVSGFHFQF